MADDGKARGQTTDRDRDRGQHIERGEPGLAPLIEQNGVERERREGGVAAEDAGGEEQPPMLRGVALQCKVGGEQTHHQRAADILEQRVPRERSAEQARREKVDAVAERRAKTATEEDDEEASHGAACAVATSAATLSTVIAGLDPAIHERSPRTQW